MYTHLECSLIITRAEQKQGLNEHMQFSCTFKCTKIVVRAFSVSYIEASAH